MMAHMCMCMCVHMCTCIVVAPTYLTPPTPRGTLGISKNLIRLEQIKIFQFWLNILNLSRLQSLECVYGLVGGWLGRLMVKSCQITNNLIKLDLIEIIQFCLKIYDLLTHSPPLSRWVGGLVDGWFNGWDYVKLVKV